MKNRDFNLFYDIFFVSFLFIPWFISSAGVEKFVYEYTKILPNQFYPFYYIFITTFYVTYKVTHVVNKSKETISDCNSKYTAILKDMDDINKAHNLSLENYESIAKRISEKEILLHKLTIEARELLLEMRASHFQKASYKTPFAKNKPNQRKSNIILPPNYKRY